MPVELPSGGDGADVGRPREALPTLATKAFEIKKELHIFSVETSFVEAANRLPVDSATEHNTRVYTPKAYDGGGNEH